MVRPPSYPTITQHGNHAFSTHCNNLFLIDKTLRNFFLCDPPNMICWFNNAKQNIFCEDRHSNVLRMLPDTKQDSHLCAFKVIKLFLVLHFLKSYYFYVQFIFRKHICLRHMVRVTANFNYQLSK